MSTHRLKSTNTRGETPAQTAPNRRETRKRELRERLLRVAIECFLEKGFEATTIDEIAERADVARATVFNHFERKEGFLAAYLAERRERVARLLAEETATGVSASTRLHHAFGLLAGINEEAPAEAREVTAAWWRTGGNSANTPDTGLVFADFVRAGQEHGDFRADIDPELAGALLLDAYVGALLRWIEADPPAFSLREELRAICDLVLAGLQRRGD
jgi:AcrR family transcriptional regulator